MFVLRIIKCNTHIITLQKEQNSKQDDDVIRTQKYEWLFNKKKDNALC